MREKAQWVRVSRKHRCPICENDTWCTFTSELVHCMRISSTCPVESGGWIHHLTDPIPVVESFPKLPHPKKDAAAIAMACCSRENAAAVRAGRAKSLGVSVGSLEDLGVGVGYDHDGREWASFPSRGANGEIIGITRRYSDGSKKTLAGTSNAGVFCKPYWWIGNGTVYIVEGPSDVAAMIDACLCVLGRPSNVGGIAVLTAYLRRHSQKRVVVVGENDAKPERRGTVQQCPKNCCGCSWCWPGRYGAITTAERLSRTLKRKVEVIMPPSEFKDVRKWWIDNRLNGLSCQLFSENN
jgi:hypothetical protein